MRGRQALWIGSIQATFSGFSTGSIRRLVWSEHGLLLGAGLASGVLAALVAVVPGNVVPGDRGPPLTPIALLVAAVALSGAAWVWSASVPATRGPLLNALQEE